MWRRTLIKSSSTPRSEWGVACPQGPQLGSQSVQEWHTWYTPGRTLLIPLWRTQAHEMSETRSSVRSQGPKGWVESLRQTWWESQSKSPECGGRKTKLNISIMEGGASQSSRGDSWQRPSVWGLAEPQGGWGGSVDSLRASRMNGMTMNHKWSIRLLILSQIFIFPLRQNLFAFCGISVSREMHLWVTNLMSFMCIEDWMIKSCWVLWNKAGS